MGVENNSFILLYRRLNDHWVWKEKPFSYGQAWVDLLIMASYSDHKFLLGGELIEAERGQIITSELKLSEKWGWSRTKVRKFLGLLEKDSMIVKKTDSKKTTLKLCQFSVWQDLKTSKKPERDSGETGERQEKDSGETQSKKGERKEVKRKKKEKAFAPPTSEEFSAYFLENGFSKDLAIRAFKTYDVANWHDTKGNPVKNWKQKCQSVWFRTEDKAINNSPEKPRTPKPILA